MKLTHLCSILRILSVISTSKTERDADSIARLCNDNGPFARDVDKNTTGGAGNNVDF
jgi:hypothetical protein